MGHVISFVDRLSRALALVVMVVIAALIVVMIFEVFMRRVLNAPTMWAFDISQMLNGVVFIGASAYALQKNEHIRIDFLSQRFSANTRNWIELLFLVFLFLPAFGMLVTAAISQAWQTYDLGTIDRVSPWAPRLWPYYTGLAVGAAAVWLQAVVEAVRAALGLWNPQHAYAAAQVVTAPGD